MKRISGNSVFLGALLLVMVIPLPTLAEEDGLKITIRPPPPIKASSPSVGFSGGQQAYSRGDWISAYKELLPLAVEGNANAQFYIGRIYDPNNEDRLGVPAMPVTAKGAQVIQNYKDALRWYLMAAKQGHVMGQRQAGMFLKYGQLYRRGYKWLKRSAEAGDGEAQYQLGIMYHYGMGMPRDDAKAAKWLALGGPNMSPYKQKQYGWQAGQGYGAPAQGKELVNILKESGGKDTDELRANRVRTGTVSHRSSTDGETEAEAFEKTPLFW